MVCSVPVLYLIGGGRCLALLVVGILPEFTCTLKENHKEDDSVQDHLESLPEGVYENYIYINNFIYI